MTETEKKLQEYESLIGVEGPEADKKRDEIVSWLETQGDDGARDAAEKLIMRNLKRIDGEILTIRQQLGDVYDLLPISYIAEHYFGKSSSWLYQRINGYKVRGHVYTLNEEQKQTLNRALAEIGKFIGSYRFA